MRNRVVLITGAPASGKSMAISELAKVASETGVLSDMYVAKRTTTSKAKPGAGLASENLYLDREAFYAATRTGAIDVHWKRTVSPDHVHAYGFSLARELDKGGVVILSANNYLDWTKHEPLQALRAEGRLMVIRIHASVNTRLKRLQDIHPKLSEMELGARMADPPAHLLPPADFVVINDPPASDSSAERLLQLVTAFRFYSLPFGGLLSADSFAQRN